MLKLSEWLNDELRYYKFPAGVATTRVWQVVAICFQIEIFEGVIGAWMQNLLLSATADLHARKISVGYYNNSSMLWNIDTCDDEG